MAEILLIIGPPVGWILYSLGGWDFVIGGRQRFKNGKIFRWLFFPLWAAALAKTQAFSDAQVATTTAIMVSYLRLVGYGDKSCLRKLFGKYIAWSIWGVGIALSMFLYGLDIYNVILAASFPLLTFISQINKLHWKIVEGVTGLLIILVIVH